MSLPIPPPEMRRLVGPMEEAAFDNPHGGLGVPLVDKSAYDSVLDFGCGCGRIARTLIRQTPSPNRYLGLDVHEGMVRWCSDNLTPIAPRFQFRHHDVYNAQFNPRRRAPRVAALAADTAAFSLFIAWSVFTHIIETDVRFYLGEARRTLRPDGVFFSTWFLFEKPEFPMLQPNQNALYTSDVDPTSAVIYDRSWLAEQLATAGFTVTGALPPQSRGNQWVITASPTRAGLQSVPLEPDAAPVGEAWVAPPRGVNYPDSEVGRAHRSLIRRAARLWRHGHSNS
jgi:SAM-dependent methyltransferase